jgi:hypothetical protein
MEVLESEVINSQSTEAGRLGKVLMPEEQQVVARPCASTYEALATAYAATGKLPEAQLCRQRAERHRQSYRL